MRPLYVPQLLHTRCETCLAPHCWHVASCGLDTFQFALRRLVLDRDIFFFGTAMKESCSC